MEGDRGEDVQTHERRRLRIDLEPIRVGDIPVRVFAPPPEYGERRSGALLLYHGLRMGSDSLEREARWIANAGFTVYAVDAPHHGYRFSDVVGHMPDALTIDGYRVLLRILREARDEIPKLVDHVLAQGHSQVAVAGVSMGAFIAIAAGTVEPRLAGIVSILGTPDWTPHNGDVPPDLVEAITESPHLQPEKFAPRPLLLLNGSRDDNVRPGPMRVFVARLKPLYAAHPAKPEATTIHHREYDSEHAVPEPIWADMWMTSIAFLTRTLG